MRLAQLRAATSIQDLADLLGYSASGLAFVLYKNPAGYAQFDIPKKFGGMRRIEAPNPALKLLQRRLSDLLLECLSELPEWKNDKLSHGFRRQRSIVSNATRHKNRHHIFNLDLSAFFGSINFGRVRGLFLKDKRFGLHPKIATVLAQIACHNNGLPQGSPCSPIISNLIGRILDMQLVHLARHVGCTYSRYADDLTFSTNKRSFPQEIAINAPLTHTWSVGPELDRIIKASGFVVNLAKVRMQYRDSRQEVTGLVVNQKLGVRREYRHGVRAMVHNLFRKGEFYTTHHTLDLLGKAVVSEIKGSSAQLQGMLAFIDEIDKQSRDANIEGGLSGRERLYRHFLFYKDFYALAAPVVLCEGKTDNVYLLHAIRSLVRDFPSLAKTEKDGAKKLLVRLYKYKSGKRSAGRIMGLTGGTPSLAKFMREYLRELRRFSAPVCKAPTVVVVDFDKGFKSIQSVISDYHGPKLTGGEPFVRVAGNLYVVCTPAKVGGQSKIEDFFPPAVLGTVLAGKTFNAENDMDSDSEYGKHVFAQKVVAPNADTIDFGGFRELLKRIEMAINHHKKVIENPEADAEPAGT